MTTKLAMEMLEELYRYISTKLPDTNEVITATETLDAAISHLRKEQAAMIPRSEVDELKRNLRRAGVICEHDGKLKGMISERNLIEGFNQLLEKYPQEPK